MLGLRGVRLGLMFDRLVKSVAGYGALTELLNRDDIEEIFVEGGQYVEKGDLILRFSNATLQRSSIDTETRAQPIKRPAPSKSPRCRRS